MNPIGPKSVQNIRELAGHLYPVSEVASRVQGQAGPMVREVHGVAIEDMLKFFYKSFSQSAGEKGTFLKRVFSKPAEWMKQKDWIIGRRQDLQSKEYVVEAVQDGDKTLGCYLLSVDKNGKDVDIECFAINPDIKKTETGAKTMLTLASRILEQAKSRGDGVIKWTVDNRNERAFKLFDKKFPARKEPSCDSSHCTDFYVSVADFEKSLKRFK